MKAYFNTLIENIQQDPSAFISDLVEFFVILIITLILFFLYDQTIGRFLKWISKKSKWGTFGLVAESIRKPLKYLILFSGIYFACVSLAATPFFVHGKGKIIALLHKFMRLILIVFIAWGMSNTVESLIPKFFGMESDMLPNTNKTAAVFLGKVVRFCIIAFAAVIVIAELGYDVNGLIAGLGLGGLTVALAAKDTTSNFLGGLVIIIDKPFLAGDWIQTPDTEGIVEDISFRSTKIRNFKDGLVLIPNSVIAIQPITNWSKMNKRRTQSELEVQLTAVAGEVEAIISDIRELLENHTGISKEGIDVTPKFISKDNYVINIYCSTMSSSSEESMAVREDITASVVKIIDNHEADVRLPVDLLKEVGTDL